jgi:hypothetical protein
MIDKNNLGIVKDKYENMSNQKGKETSFRMIIQFILWLQYCLYKITIAVVIFISVSCVIPDTRSFLNR